MKGKDTKHTCVLCDGRILRKGHSHLYYEQCAIQYDHLPESDGPIRAKIGKIVAQLVREATAQLSKKSVD